MLSIDIDKADLEKKTNKFINDISNFNHKHKFSATAKLYSIYPNNHVTYNP